MSYLSSLFVTKKIQLALLKSQVFQIGSSNQKIPQSDRGSKNHFGFQGQVDFNKSNMTKMVLLTNLKVVLLTNPKAVVLIIFFTSGKM
jgi:hypothetical protein